MAPRSRHSTSKKDTAPTPAPQANHVIPDMTKLADITSPTASRSGTTAMNTNGEIEKDPEEVIVNGMSGGAGLERAVDLNELTRRQLEEDVKAYRYDLDFSTEILRDSSLSLSAQEVRTTQFRCLDLGHQIRHCQHRLEQIDAQHALVVSAATNGRPQFYFDTAPKRRATGPPNGGTPVPIAKRPRTSQNGTDMDETMDAELVDGTSVQRLGYWMCHLCTANKYLSAGQNRVPSAPCKWPLRDVSKMLTHFLDMHTEHDPEERCIELGNALSSNRGPFEYWLTRTKHMKVRDSDIMDECINSLLAGSVPEALKKINRAASVFPNSMSMKDKTEEASVA